MQSSKTITIAIFSNSNGFTALRKAIYKGFDEIVKLLLENGADCSLIAEGVDKNGKKVKNNCLHMAVSSENPKIVSLLLKQKKNNKPLLDINAKDSCGLTALHKAINKDSYAIVKLLLENGADCSLTQKGVNSKEKKVENNYLHIAVARGNPEIVSLLINKKDEKGNRLIDINAKNTKGFTPLHSAICNDSDKIVKLLLESGADCTLTLDREDSRGCLHMAASSRNPETVRLLLEQKDEKGNRLLDINAKNSGGWTPLMMAAKEGNLKILNLLIDKGANLLEQDSNGNTALISAMFSKKIKNEQKQLKIIDKLIETAPNIIVCPDNQGINAIQKAYLDTKDPKYQEKYMPIFQILYNKASDAGLEINRFLNSLNG